MNKGCNIRKYWINVMILVIRKVHAKHLVSTDVTEVRVLPTVLTLGLITVITMNVQMSGIGIFLKVGYILMLTD